jgi:hypothetical protein
MNVKYFLRLITTMALGFSAFADEDTVQIDNQWTYSAENSTWGSVYVGKYTTNNTLNVIPYREDGSINAASLETDEAYVGYSDTAHNNFAQIYGGVDYTETWEDGVLTITTNTYESIWSADDLTIGTDANSNNTVWVGWTYGVTSYGNLEAGGMGMLEIDGDLTINGASNGNSLVIGNYGTLKITGDMDASMDGFYFDGSNSVLAVGGTLTGINDLDGGYQELQLFGDDAAWEPTNGTVVVGGTTDSNTLSLTEGASLSLTNLTIGATNTYQNSVLVQDSGTLSIYGSIELFAGAANSNALEISNGGILKVYSDFYHTGSSSNIYSGLQLRDGTAKFYGDFTASGGLIMDAGTVELYGITNRIPALDGNGTVTLGGTNSIWSANELLIGTITTNVISTNTDVTLGAVEVYIEDSNVLSIDHFVLGTADTNMGCTITIENGAQLVLTNAALSVNNIDNPLVLESGSKVTFVNDIAYTNVPYISIDTGVTYEFLSEGFILPGADWGDWSEYGYFSQRYESTNIFNGTSATLNLNSYNVHVGDVDGDNTLIFTNGASGVVKTLSIGDFDEGDGGNLVVISGTDSTFSASSYISVGGTIIDDEWHEGSDNNTLRVEDMARLTADTIYNQNSGGDSGIEIASGAQVDVDNYYQGSGAFLTIMTDSTGTNVGHLAANEAEFEAGAKVGVDAVSRLTLDQSYTNSIITAGTLIVDGVTNGTSLSALSGSGGSIVYYDLSLEDGTNIMAVYSRRSLADAGDYDSDSVLAEISDEIDTMASAGNVAASNQLEILNLMSSTEVAAQMNQLYSYSIPTYQHSQALFSGLDQAQSRGIAFHDGGPIGVYGPGPHNSDQGFQPWIDVYGGFGTRDQSGSYDNGYDSTVYGTVIGVDRAFGELLVGLAGGYAGSIITGDNGDESDASTAYGILYGSYGTKQWFADLSLGLGSTSMDNTSGTAFDVASSTDASQAAFYAGIGYEMFNEDSGSFFRPLFAVQSSLFSQDAYTETATTAVAKDVDGYDRWNFQSVMGGEIIVPKSGLNIDYEMQLRAYWLHEYNDDSEMVDYSLVGSSQIGEFEMRAPESDLALLGLGFVAKLENGLQLRADVDGQVGEDYYSMLFSGALRYEF